jgi:hypothetical protein
MRNQPAPFKTRKAASKTRRPSSRLTNNPAAGRPTGSRPRRPQTPMDNPSQAGGCFEHRTHVSAHPATLLVQP